MSLAAVPVYLLARRLGLSARYALACAAFTVAIPDLVFASYTLADPIAFPLALTAIYAGVVAVEQPSKRAQLAFLGFALLATLARVQYVVLPAAFLVAALRRRPAPHRADTAPAARALRAAGARRARGRPVARARLLLAGRRPARRRAARPLGGGRRLPARPRLGGRPRAGRAGRSRASARAHRDRLRGARHGVRARTAVRGGALRVERVGPLPGALPVRAAAARADRVRALPEARPPRPHGGRIALGRALRGHRALAALGLLGGARQDRLAVPGRRLPPRAARRHGQRIAGDRPARGARGRRRGARLPARRRPVRRRRSDRAGARQLVRRDGRRRGDARARCATRTSPPTCRGSTRPACAT